MSVTTKVETKDRFTGKAKVTLSPETLSLTDAAQQQKWQDIAEAVMMGRYKVPPTALAGRPKDPA